MALEREVGVWQAHARLAVVLELVFAWLRGGELARASAACGAWRGAAQRSAAWRRLLQERAPGAGRAVRALTKLYDGACPWRELYLAAVAPWRRVARLAPAAPVPARLAAAALSRAGDLLALAADDCSFTVWVVEHGRWLEAGAGSVAALGWSGVSSAAWAPDAAAWAPDASSWAPDAAAARLLLCGRAPLSAQRGALAVLQPVTEGAWSVWCVAARASGTGGCWAGAAFLSLELRRLSAPEHAPHYATDVWLNAATQEADSEFAGVAARVLRIYNEARAVTTQVVCADVPLDARAAQEWAEAEAAVRAQDERGGGGAGGDDGADVAEEERAPGEAYYRATYDRGRSEHAQSGAEAAWVRVLVLACGGVLGAWPLRRDAPPPLRVCAGALRERVQARRARRLQEAEAAVAAAPQPASAAELRAQCDAPAARLRLPAPILGLAVHNNGRSVWASVLGGAACASLPALRVLRVVRAAPGPGPHHHLQPHASDEYFGSPVGGSGCEATVWCAASGAGARLRPLYDPAPALALLLCPAPHHAPDRAPSALLLTKAALHVFECASPRAPPPPCLCADADADADAGSAEDCNDAVAGCDDDQ